MPTTHDTIARLEARLPGEVHALLKRAADLQGTTLTDFVVSAASKAARKAIEDSEIIRLSAEDQANLAVLLLNPPKPAAALVRAAKRYRQHVGRSAGREIQVRCRYRSYLVAQS